MSQDTKDDALELIRTYLPKYLTPDQKDNLFSVVKENFPLSNNSKLIYYNFLDADYFYQGDAIIDIPFAEFNNGEYSTIYLNGVVMSNTCDISPENERLDKSFVQLSSVFALKDYIETLVSNGIVQPRIDSFIKDLKSNRISNLFYLPAKMNGNKTMLEESFIRFDLNVTLPLSVLENDSYDNEYIPKGDRIFSFSNYGFYLFLIKLSIHYCRFKEGVFRSA